MFFFWPVVVSRVYRVFATFGASLFGEQQLIGEQLGALAFGVEGGRFGGQRFLEEASAPLDGLGLRRLRPAARLLLRPAPLQRLRQLVVPVETETAK